MSKLLKGMLWTIGKALPLERSVYVSCFYGKGFNDNSKYIIEALHSINPKIKIYWTVKDATEKASLPSYINPCIYGSVDDLYHMITSKVWLDNCRKGFRYKRNKQLYVQTWHGGGAQKRAERDVIDTLYEGYEAKAIKDSSAIDIAISDSKIKDRFYKEAFWYSGPVAQIGYPRYDIMLQSDKWDKIKEKVHTFFELSCDTRIILYAPTFRKDLSFDAYDIDYERLCDACNKKYGGKHVVCIRLHPAVADKCKNIKYSKRIINGTVYPDMQELMVASDIMISDYSSAIFDFALTRRPAFRYSADIYEYMRDRNFYFSVDEYPYPLARNNDELEERILNFDKSKYLSDLDVFFEKVGMHFNTNASEDCARIINDYCFSDISKRELIAKYQSVII